MTATATVPTEGAAKVRLRTIVTPEGVPLRFEVASAGLRVGAFFIDFTIVVVLFIAAIFSALAALNVLPASVVAVGFFLFTFGLRFFYFIGFELRWQGRTPGKRIVGLRVIDRGGGPLLPDAVIARNLTREIEVWYPLISLFLPMALWPAAPGWVSLGAILWLGIVAMMPLFNKDRMRIGDLIGGTIVVSAPKMVLLRDLTAQKESSDGEARYTFTREQLDMYGIYELQVLERLLRRSTTDKNLLESVCEKIKRKIAWDRQRWNVDTRRFLSEFYGAQRGRLEHRMLYGDRRERKQEGRLEEK